MEITSVKITPVSDAGRYKAAVVVKFDDCFVVKGMRLIKGRQRWFVAMPDKKIKDGSYMDMAYPLGTEFRDRLEAAVLAEYKKVTTNFPLSQRGTEGDLNLPLCKRGTEGDFAA